MSQYFLNEIFHYYLQIGENGAINYLAVTIIFAITDNCVWKINKDMIPDSKILEFRSKTYRKQENYEGITEFKRILNYFIDFY